MITDLVFFQRLRTKILTWQSRDISERGLSAIPFIADVGFDFVIIYLIKQLIVYLFKNVFLIAQLD